MSTHYRPDIDGLRAVAVIPVVLFHSKISLFGTSLFPGGFVGVDIFFVISGYLISNILLHDISRDQFSILTFYERRIRRIFPALFAVLLAATFAAFVILLPGALGEMDYFGTHLFGATFFYSNYQFMSETGYFAAAAEDNPLLHLWSLAVEEQFYIVFPVYLYFISRFFRDRLGLATMAVLLVSLVYSIYLVQNNPADAFYSTPARAWELMLGAILAIFPRKAPLDQRVAQLLGAAGLGFIAYSILFYSAQTPFPGAAALAPCVGAALILYTGQRNMTLAGRLLSTSAFRYPGLISYSLYLWHWPVLVFYRMYAITPVSQMETAMLLVAMTAAAWASWKFVEAPFRTRNVLAKQNPLFAAGAGVMLVSAACGAIIGFNDGFPGRLPE
ncbi:MAG: acyltransferase family protein [Pseudomonadota bacterium]